VECPKRSKRELIVNAISAQHGGIVTYTLNLVRHMRNSDLVGKVFVPPDFFNRINERDLAGVSLVNADLSGQSGLTRLLWEQLNWRRTVRKSGAKVLYSSANYGLIYPPIPQILMVQGEISFNPYYQKAVLPRLSLKERLSFALRRRLVLWSMRHSDIVLFPSETARSSVVGKDPKLAGKSRVNYLCAAESLKNLKSARGWRENEEIRALYVSVYYPHKDPLTLVRAIQKIRSGGRKATARITMKNEDFAHWSCGPGELKLLRAPENRDSINLKHIPHKNIASELKNYDVVVSTSLAETFGFPLVESMAAGIPVVATDIPIHREICGDAALYFPPGDSEALADEIMRLDKDPELREILVKNGEERSRTMFSWSRHIDILSDSVTDAIAAIDENDQHDSENAA
jgi:glycosyltransferase involved in cell wall biosynthesis